MDFWPFVDFGLKFSPWFFSQNSNFLNLLYSLWDISHSEKYYFAVTMMKANFDNKYFM